MVCKLGDQCKAFAASRAVLALTDASGVAAEDIRRTAKAISKVCSGVRRLRLDYVRAYKKYEAAIKTRHSEHEMLMKKGRIVFEHHVLCTRPLLVAEALHHVELQIAWTDVAMLALLPRNYRRQTPRKKHLSLLDLVTEPLLPAFRDKEIADLIPDGLVANQVQRVSNRRWKLRKSRLQPGERRAPESKR